MTTAKREAATPKKQFVRSCFTVDKHPFWAENISNSVTTSHWHLARDATIYHRNISEEQKRPAGPGSVTSFLVLICITSGWAVPVELVDVRVTVAVESGLTHLPWFFLTSITKNNLKLLYYKHGRNRRTTLFFRIDSWARAPGTLSLTKRTWTLMWHASNTSTSSSRGVQFICDFR